MYKKIYLFFLVSACGICCRPRLEEGEFDRQAWQSDTFGCEGARQSMVRDFQELRPQLIKLNTKEIMGLLGRPDAEELRAGSERVFIYYLEPGPPCKGGGRSAGANKVQVRFNALNQVSEVSYTQPIGDLLRR
jgi:hypothetical protein